MSDIQRAFARCKEAKRAAFIPFIMAGDPDLETTGELLYALVDGGADIIELGVPFSDPIADGPTNQRAAVRALESGTTLSGILRLIAKHRDRLRVPIVLFSYYNPIHTRGVERFAEQAASSGVDGVLCVDLPPDEGDEFIPALSQQGLDTIFLLAPTSTPARIKKVNEASSGFVYYVSRTGVTGTKSLLPRRMLRQVNTLRKRMKHPLAVGFGISKPKQVAAIARVADGVVVGSELVKIVEEKAGQDDLASTLAAHVRMLSAPLHKS